MIFMDPIEAIKDQILKRKIHEEISRTGRINIAEIIDKARIDEKKD